MLKAFRGVQGLQNIYESYDRDTDNGVLARLRRGKVSGCECAKCRTLATVFRLQKGGQVKKSDFRRLTAECRAALIQYICLRQLGGTNG